MSEWQDARDEGNSEGGRRKLVRRRLLRPVCTGKQPEGFWWVLRTVYSARWSVSNYRSGRRCLSRYLYHEIIGVRATISSCHSCRVLKDTRHLASVTRRWNPESNLELSHATRAKTELQIDSARVPLCCPAHPFWAVASCETSYRLKS